MSQGNELHIWWLAETTSPRLVGRLGLHGGRASFVYCSEWMEGAGPIPLSPDLPLRADRFHAQAPGAAPGAIDDARPDGWGKMLIRLVDDPGRLGILELLHLAGDGRMGALGTSFSPVIYEPVSRPPRPTLGDIESMHAATQAASRGERLSRRAADLLSPGAGLGGARPKALIDIDGEAWIVKFSERGDEFCSPAAEHAAMRLARDAGVDVSETRLIDFGSGNAVAVRRFDRVGQKRMHAISARTALRAAGLPDSYPALASLLPLGDRAQLFRRMVFNILVENTDDHSQNHALYFDGVDLRLTPAFDIVPTGLGLRYQSMDMGAMGADSTLANAISKAGAFGLSQEAAAKVVHDVTNVIDGWRLHFALHGATDEDIKYLADFIDRRHRHTRVLPPQE